MDSDNNVTSREFMWRDVCLNVEQKEKYQNLFFLPNVTCHTVVIINNVLGDSVNWWVLSKLEKSKLEPNKLFFDNSKWCFLRFRGFFHIIFISWRNSSSALFLWSMFMLLDVTGNISFFVVDEFSKSLHMSNPTRRHRESRRVEVVLEFSGQISRMICAAVDVDAWCRCLK
jgi:hypothetical protein